MRTITLTPRKATPRLFAALEKRGLIRTLRPTAKTLRTRTRTGAVETISVSSPAYGSHLLLAVGKRSLEPEFGSHPDNEELILLKSPAAKYKPLFLLVARDRPAVFARKAASGKLSARDFVAVELRFNDPATSIFTMCKDTVHCEVTVPGKGQHPVFFVTEPSQLPTRQYWPQGIRVEIRKAGRKDS